MTKSACADPRLRPLRTRHARAQEWRYPADCGVDVAAMRAYRLARARRFIADGGLSAALLFDPLNVRYAPIRPICKCGLCTISPVALSSPRPGRS